MRLQHVEPGNAVLRQPLIAVAPMMDWTDRHERYLLRLISERVLLYTEMISVGAILHGDRQRHLRYSPAEHPLAIQLGGADPGELAECALIAEQFGYLEVNLNVGCPSDRVQNGQFGACLMTKPELVADCVAAMQAKIQIPVSVKCRTGIDDDQGLKRLHTLSTKLAQAGCRKLIVHARNAWLKGLSPKQNRNVPPLNYDLVYQIKQNFPHLHISLNGGLTTPEQIPPILKLVDGVMIGRAAYQTPYLLHSIDRLLYPDALISVSRFQVLEAYLDYMQHQLASDVPIGVMSRHLFGLFHGLPGARAWRRQLTEKMYQPGATLDMIRAAARHIKIEGSESVLHAHRNLDPCTRATSPS